MKYFNYSALESTTLFCVLFVSALLAIVLALVKPKEEELKYYKRTYEFPEDEHTDKGAKWLWAVVAFIIIAYIFI